MFSLRGDAHKLYLQLKQAANKDQSFNAIKAIKKVEGIQNFYTSIDSDTLKNIYYCMIKEKNGSGMIPILISSAPWILLIFSKQLQEFLFRDGSFLWAIFVFAYLTILTVSVILHFYEKAWASVHIEMIQEILHDRKKISSDDMMK